MSQKPYPDLTCGHCGTTYSSVIHHICTDRASIDERLGNGAILFHKADIELLTADLAAATRRAEVAEADADRLGRLLDNTEWADGLSMRAHRDALAARTDIPSTD